MSVRTTVVGPHDAATQVPAWPPGIVPETAYVLISPVPMVTVEAGVPAALVGTAAVNVY